MLQILSRRLHFGRAQRHVRERQRGSDYYPVIRRPGRKRSWPGGLRRLEMPCGSNATRHFPFAGTGSLAASMAATCTLVTIGNLFLLTLAFRSFIVQGDPARALLLRRRSPALNRFPRAVFPLVLAYVLFAATRNTLFAASASTKPARLTYDSLVEPVGIDDARPLFSWQLRDSGFGARQTAYQVQVATKVSSLNEDKPDVWDSGKVTSDRSVGVAYGGPALAAEKRYYWRVKVWNKD